MNYESRIYNKAVSDGLPALLSSFLVFQAAHETAGFTSNVFLSCNNINGYKWVGQSTALGPCVKSPEGDYYAKYATIEDSVHEAVLWIRRRQKEGLFPADLNDITSIDQYAELLKAAQWYGDTVDNYTSGLYYWMNRVSSLITSPAGKGSLVFVLLVLGLIAYRKKFAK